MRKSKPGFRPILMAAAPLGLCVLAFAFARDDERLAGLEVADGLEVGLFAAEPMLVNPTNLDVDARGRVWVLEGFNYRTGLNPDNPVREEGDRILILEDTDGDGQADTETVYYQGNDVNAALGIAVLGEKVIVSAYKNVFVFTDTDGDDHADSKEVLFKLSDEDHDHTVHAFVFGPDGRLYFNFGNEGKELMDPQGRLIVDEEGRRVVADSSVYRQGMVLRANLDGTDVEVLGHNFRNPYEVAVDAYGTLWQSDNDDDGNRGTRINYVMEHGNYGYRDEMTGAGWRTPRTGMEAEIPLRHWHLNDPGVVPNLLQTGAGSPTGLLVYEGDLLPERFRGEMIHADAGPNVVRAYPVTPEGAGYRAEIINIVQGTGDPWFRPSDVAAASDGSLFIADWRDPGVGGHRVDDQDQGRVLRVAPPGTPYRPSPPDLSAPSGAAEALMSPNVAARYLAWQKLAAWGKEAEPALAAQWDADDPHHRARALWLLARLEPEGQRYVEEALQDDDPNLRITGLRVARQQGLDVLAYVAQLAKDPSPLVRREAALALRHRDAPEAARLWTQLALQHDGEDRWYLEALGIAADGQWDRFFAAWREQVGEGWKSPAGRDVVWRARTEAALPLLAQLITDAGTTPEERPRYFRAFDFHPDSPEKEAVLKGLLAGDHPDQTQITALALAHLASDDAAPSPDIAAALERTLGAVEGTMQYVDLVRRFGLDDRNDALVAMAFDDPEGTTGVEAARLALGRGGKVLFQEALRSDDAQTRRRALTVLGYASDREAQELLKAAVQDASRTLPQREEALRALGLSLGGEWGVLGLVESGELDEALEPAAATLLFNSYSPTLREAAGKHLTPPAVQAAGGAELPPVSALVARAGNAEAGAAVFTRACASCHQVNGQGIDFGPNLSEIGTKLPKEALYEAILHPSAGISFGYEGYVIRLQDGTEAAGYIASETEDELALRQPGGITTRYDKAQVVSREPMDASLMPAGLEQAMTEGELVDLVAYLSTLKK